MTRVCNDGDSTGLQLMQSKAVASEAESYQDANSDESKP